MLVYNKYVIKTAFKIAENNDYKFHNGHLKKEVKKINIFQFLLITF